MTEHESHSVEELEETGIIEEAESAPARHNGKVSPVLILLLVSGVLGMLAAVAMLMSEDRPPITGEPAQVLGGASTRSLRNWEAEDFELPSLEGETVRLSDFEGRMIFINFWRTDCAPCVRELPALQAFSQEQGEHGAVVLAVNQGESGEDIQAFLNRLGISDLPVLLDRYLDIERSYPVSVLPTTYIVDGDGFVQYLKLGEITLEDMYVYLSELDRDPTPRG